MTHGSQHGGGKTASFGKKTINSNSRSELPYHINLLYSEEDGGYIADIPDLKACSAFGATAEEALKEVEAARAA